MVKRCILICVVLFSLAATSFASVLPMKLEELAKRSDYIVVGKVARTRFVEGQKIAELHVIRTLKGDPGVKRLYFSATPDWACDISDARVNETGLFFLESGDVPNPHAEYERYLKRIQRLTGGAPFFYISFSGRGRKVFKHVGGKEYIYISRKGDLIYPISLEFALRPDLKDADLGLVRVEDVLALIASYIANRPAA
jgi:hypothetical protein